MKKIRNKKCSAFTLVEVLAALTVGAMVLLAVLTMYSRAQSAAASCIAKIENHRLPREVLQRIAEDIDRVAGSGQDVKINIENKFQEGLPVAKIEFTRLYSDAKNQPQTLEKIVWQSNIDPDTGMLTLYRSHSGIAMEDKLLDEQKENWQRELFVPVCAGLTHFKIEVPQGEELIGRWAGDNLPAAIVVTMSFAMPFKTVTGTLDVPEEDKIIRNIVVDRTRKPAFTLAAIDANDVNQPEDANETDDANDLSNANTPSDPRKQRLGPTPRPGGMPR